MGLLQRADQRTLLAPCLPQKAVSPEDRSKQRSWPLALLPITHEAARLFGDGELVQSDVD